MTEVIVSTVRSNYQESGMPVKTIDIAAQCYMSRWTAARWLKQLERSGKVKRIGQRTGWEPIN